MKLTQTSRTLQDDNSFPTLQLFVLAICRVAEPIAFTSILPYSWLMVKGFDAGDHNDASFYAGILISAFALSESITGMFWGGISDRMGRKPVLLFGCCGTLLSLLIVGFSRSFAMALAGRVLGGLLNGNVGVVQTMVGELVKKPEHEPKAYSVMPFVWSIGTIIGPAIGGTFADPVRNFPATFPKDSFFEKFPWLLPNLICASLMGLSIVAGYFLLEETHPDFCKDADPSAQQPIAEQTPMIAASGAATDPGVDLRQESYGTFNEVEFRKGEQWQVTEDGADLPAPLAQKFHATKWFTWKVAMLVLSLGIYCYHSMCWEHLIPIFFQQDRADDVSILATTGLLHIRGGLGLSTQTVGLIMSVNGIIALLVQVFIFPIAADRLGVWRVFVLVIVLHPIAYFIVPYTALLPKHLMYPGIYACLTLRNVCNILQYPVSLILLKQACPSPAFLGRINGLAASIGAASRTLAPPIAGMLYSVGLEVGFTGLAFWGAGMFAFIGCAQLYLVPRERNDNSTIKSVVPCFAAASSVDEAPKDIVRINVVDIAEEV